MGYLKVGWRHDHPDEPVTLYSECDDFGWEVRKVEIFRDGRVGYAGDGASAEDSSFGAEPLPKLDAIGSQSEFHPTRITQREFELAWARAHMTPARAK